MTQAISFDVTVERHEPSGAFVARCSDFPRKIGIGLTEEEAVADLRAFILAPMPPLPAVPTPATGNPWAEVAGTMKGHPLLAEWKQALEEYRAAKDQDEEAQR
jgi:hypothetical protein